jgi:hypothetical protein
MALALDDQNYDLEVAMWQFADVPGKHMFLIMKQLKFEVVHGMWHCTPIQQLGEHIAWLMGDCHVITRSTVPPGLLIKALGHQPVMKVEVQAPALDDLCAASEAQLVEPLHAKDDTKMWLMLPIHVKLA